MDSKGHLALADKYCAHNYSPVPVVIDRAEGSWAWDVEGKKYFDMMAAFGAINFGHGNPRFAKAATEQLKKMTMISRAFMHDQLSPFCEELAKFCGLDVVLTMNSGAEAVETAIKAARKWGETVKGVPANKAEIICMENNFAGRTISIISFSTEEHYRAGFGPFTPGFVVAPFGDIEALKKLVNSNTVAVLTEPIQGEGGIIIPPDGFLRDVRNLCDSANLLFIADEIQTGLCRTGEIFACEHEKVKPDMYLLGKSLGGGITPLSAVVGKKEVMDVFTPGTHGSTFGGNSFACAIGREVLRFITEEKPHLQARVLGSRIVERLHAMKSRKIEAIRARGLMVGIDIAPNYGKAKKLCLLLAEKGLLCKDTREQTLRFTPPLTSKIEDLDWAMDQVESVLRVN